MLTNWRKSRLGDLVTVRHGWPFKSEQFSAVRAGRPIVVSIGNFRYTGGFRFSSTAVKEYTGDYPPEYELSGGDLLLVMTCQTAGGEILGIPARIPRDGKKYLHNQRLGLVVPKKSAEVDRDYLYWLFLSREFNRHLVATASGTKILHTAPTRIEAFEFMLPPLATQRKIGGVLRSLDDKIELNRQMNETLEAMARALFKSWFVDFDPVHAKAAGRAPIGMDAETAQLFPSEFVHSDLGSIPKGWSISSIGELADVVGGSTPSTKEPQFWEGGRHFWATPKDLSSLENAVISATERLITDSGLAQIGSGLLPVGTVLLSSRAPIGYLGIAEVPLAVNQGFIAMKPLAGVSNHFLLRWAEWASAEIVSRANGSTFLEISKSNFRPIKLVAPTSQVFTAFQALADTLHRRVVSNVRESKTLSTLRDALLPRLLSGELALSQVMVPPGDS